MRRKDLIRHRSRILAAVLAILVFSFCAVPCYAADSEIIYEGNGQFSYNTSSEYSDTQLFPEFEGVMPGDVITQNIRITNKADAAEVRFYLRAEAHGESNPIATGIDETEASMKDFLAQLSMTVYNGDEVIFEASPDQTDGLTESVYLCTLAKGQSAALQAVLTVPAELGNEYMGRAGEVDWILTVEEEEQSESSEESEESEESSEAHESSEEPGSSEESVPSEESHEESSEESAEESSGGSIDTGDRTVIWPWAVGAGGSLAAIAFLLVVRQKKNRQDQEE